MNVQPGDRFHKSIVLTETEISRFASAAGDTNPLHHDPHAASHHGYTGIVASGPQTSALLMGLTAHHFSRIAPMLGLEFTFLFRAAVPANSHLTMEWLVIRVEPKTRLKGSIVELRGRLRIGSTTAVGAKGKVLVRQPNR